MGKLGTGRWGSLLPTRRRLIQVYAALLYNAYVKGFLKGEIYTGPIKNVCVPGLNCYSCPGAVGACPLGALQNALSSSGYRAPYYAIGILMLWGLTLGRSICGWICPFGLLQELLHRLPGPKLKKSSCTRTLSRLKYGILGIFVLGIPLISVLRYVPIPGFCKYICPAGTLEGAVSLLSHPVNRALWPMLGGLFIWKLFLMVLILAACVFVYRAFCRFLCPLGAIYGLFSRISLLGVRPEPDKCTDCGRCVRHCKMDICRVGDRECIHCGSCISDCPAKALSFRLGNIRLAPDPSRGHSQRIRTAVGCLCALVLLVLLLFFVNRAA